MIASVPLHFAVSRGGEMVDARDLKSLILLQGCVGSIPTPGTKNTTIYKY